MQPSGAGKDAVERDREEQQRGIVDGACENEQAKRQREDRHEHAAGPDASDSPASNRPMTTAHHAKIASADAAGSSRTNPAAATPVSA